MEKQMQYFVQEAEQQLQKKIIPFWKTLRDDEYGGYYGFLSSALVLDKKAEKGCILNSRILWFFSKAYTVLKQEEREDKTLLSEAEHSYRFLKETCMDFQNGGVFWSLSYDGTPKDTTKHTYAQAFAIYALSVYYEASEDKEALKMACSLFDLIEEKCTDENGYLEAFTRDWKPQSNEKLSENGVLAERTMNTLLHIFEAYTELLRVLAFVLEPFAQKKAQEVRKRMFWILTVFSEKIYAPKLHRQEVFFDRNYESLLDLHSYGHDIETAWLIDRGIEIIESRTQKGGFKQWETESIAKAAKIARDLTAEIYKTAFDGCSVANECECGVVDEDRIWWVQAEAVVGFLNGYEREPQKIQYLQAAVQIMEFIRQYVTDKRDSSEWFWKVKKDGTPIMEKPIVEPWKCPYHNGRMCLELIKRCAGKGEV